MGFQLNRINPNQTQVHFHDGRFETLTNEELEEFMGQMNVDVSLQEEGTATTDTYM